jgi:Na+-driven multidrug efflux pump
MNRSTSICRARAGLRDRYGALCCLKQGLVLSAILSVVLTGAALFFTEPMIHLGGAKEDTFDMAVSFYRIILLGLPLNNLSLTISAAQRGIGQTKVSMRINMLSNAVNLLFCYLLINGVWIFPSGAWRAPRSPR